MSSPIPSSYDEVPYASRPFPQTHPNHLAAVARLFGLSPPPVSRCRVLELGCAGGDNLLAMAASLPHATLTGVDLSRHQAREGQELASRAGLANVRLLPMSILDIDEPFGLFDYTICHGVYSWVPPPVQDKILEVCRQNLAPDGIAYVSYNTLPGWHLRGMIRDMMLYYAGQFTDPMTRVRQARGLLDFLAQAVGEHNTPYGSLLRSEVETVRQQSDSYLFHEYLEEFNEPVYFHQFIRRAEDKGLRYMGESDLTGMVPGNFRPEVEQVLQRLARDPISLDQYMDFLRNRTFRQTLLCHQAQAPSFEIDPARLRGLHVASPVKPASASPDISSGAPEEFRGLSGLTVTTCEPVVKASLHCLAESWPRSLTFEALLAAARARLGGPGDERGDAEVLGRSLLSFYLSASTHLVEVLVEPSPFVADVSAQPMASPLARVQAETSVQVSNLRQQPVRVTEFHRQLLLLLDGSRDLPELVRALTHRARRGELSVTQAGQPLTDLTRLESFVCLAVGQELPVLASQALLIK